MDHTDIATIGRRSGGVFPRHEVSPFRNRRPRYIRKHDRLPPERGRLGQATGETKGHLESSRWQSGRRWIRRQPLAPFQRFSGSEWSFDFSRESTMILLQLVRSSSSRCAVGVREKVDHVLPGLQTYALRLRPS